MLALHFICSGCQRTLCNDAACAADITREAACPVQVGGLQPFQPPLAFPCEATVTHAWLPLTRQPRVYCGRDIQVLSCDTCTGLLAVLHCHALSYSLSQNLVVMQPHFQ